LRLPIDEIKVVDRARRDLGDVQALADSIKTLGLLQPPVVTQEHVLVAGERHDGHGSGDHTSGPDNAPGQVRGSGDGMPSRLGPHGQDGHGDAAGKPASDRFTEGPAGPRSFGAF